MQGIKTIPLKHGKARMGWSGEQITCEAVVGAGLYLFNITCRTPEQREESLDLLRQIESCL